MTGRRWKRSAIWNITLATSRLRLAIELAKERRPFLKQQKAIVLSDAEQVRVARAGYFPQISASGGSEVRSSAFTDNPRDVSSGYIFGATGTWAIWDWGATYGAVKQARAVLEESKITYDDANRQVELEVQQQDSNLKQSAELVKATEQSVGQAEEALRLASARLSAGAGTQLEVLDSRVAGHPGAVEPAAGALQLQRGSGGIRSGHGHGSHLFERARRADDARKIEDGRAPHASAQAESARTESRRRPPAGSGQDDYAHDRTTTGSK